jgi:hypothetical protein
MHIFAPAVLVGAVLEVLLLDVTTLELGLTVGRQLHALLTRLATFPVQPATA